MIGPRYFALIPAGGSGSRIRNASPASVPKQYMSLGHLPMLRHVLDTFAAASVIEQIYLVVSPEDALIGPLLAAAPSLQRRLTVLHCGGASRHQSVLNGLQTLGDDIDPDDWMLVHDAARPGLTPALIDKLITAVGDDPVGGLLAVPVADTVKRADSGRVQQTVDRTALWTAQTPQMFRFALLLRALQTAQNVTDEASAIEALGLRPMLVEGSSRNFKVTLPDDVALATAMLKGLP